MSKIHGELEDIYATKRSIQKKRLSRPRKKQPGDDWAKGSHQKKNLVKPKPVEGGLDPAVAAAAATKFKEREEHIRKAVSTVEKQRMRKSGYKKSRLPETDPGGGKDPEPEPAQGCSCVIL